MIDTYELDSNQNCSENEKKEKIEVKSSNRGLRGDYGNLCLLLLLYILQGVPMGLLYAIPMILSSNKVPYDKQAIFSIAMYPSATKLAWAPIVDSVYSTRFGRRKSWLIPVQYCIGAVLISVSSFTDDLIGTKEKPPMIYLLTGAMFAIVLLTAIQDTAVDSWGLTLLQPHNVHYVAASNAVGMVMGTFLSTGVFLALESATFCNKWLRKVPQETGIVDIQTFFFAIGLMFIISTTLIWIFKREGNSVIPGNETQGPLHTYKLLMKILKLKSIRWFTLIQFTQFIGISVFFAASELKIIQFGVPKETLSLLKAPISVLNIFLPFIVVHATKKAPLVYFWKFGVIRQFLGLFMVLLVYWTQTFNNPKDGFPLYFYVITLIMYIIYDIVIYSNFMSMFAYMTTVADPNIGATYMTLFSTISHIGMKWTTTASLALIEPLSIWETVDVLNPANSTLAITSNTTTTIPNFFNETLIATNATTAITQKQVVKIDGFYIEAVVCMVFGFIWFLIFKRMIWTMQSWPLSKWRIKEVNKDMENNKELNLSLMAVSALKSDDV